MHFAEQNCDCFSTWPRCWWFHCFSTWPRCWWFHCFSTWPRFLVLCGRNWSRKAHRSAFSHRRLVWRIQIRVKVRNRGTGRLGVGVFSFPNVPLVKPSWLFVRLPGVVCPSPSEELAPRLNYRQFYLEEVYPH